MGWIESFILILAACAVSFLYGIAWADLRHDRKKLKRAKDFFDDIAKRTKEMEDCIAKHYIEEARKKYGCCGNTAQSLNLK